eukprot:CAMPEP_0194487124 /NCGR_PEP_ID=MMETSP0253-20130528/7519_1 /TAXON_ID=2966 /ORGANISM="Noctiluca scintillans" /LENGTH=231 /DNA_ID=CAMNT_0039327299 /DNA_START=49 /DNA_END=742 /DNA_ORIENTATION=-
MEFDPQRYTKEGSIDISDVTMMKRAFDMIDVSRDGSISPEELEGAAVALGLPIEDNIKDLLGDAEITFDQFFERLTAKLTPEDKVEDISDIFELFDKQSTGTISHEDLKNVAAILQVDVNDSGIMQILQNLDTDGDQELDPVDFYAALVGGMRLRMDAEHNQLKARTARQKAEQSVVAAAGDPAAQVLRSAPCQSASVMIGCHREARCGITHWCPQSNETLSGWVHRYSDA